MKGFEGGQGRNGQRVNIFCILSLTLKHRTYLMIKLKKKKFISFKLLFLYSQSVKQYSLNYFYSYQNRYSKSKLLV